MDFFSARAKSSTEQDRQKSCRIVNFLFATIEDIAMLEADYADALTWRMDSSLAACANDMIR